jgi:hypothetical protein
MKDVGKFYGHLVFFTAELRVVRSKPTRVSGGSFSKNNLRRVRFCFRKHQYPNPEPEPQAQT